MTDMYYLSGFLELKLGLKRGYFRQAYNKKYNLNVSMKLENDKFLFVQLPRSVVDLLNQGYIATKIDGGDIKEFEHVFEMSKNYKIGFWK